MKNEKVMQLDFSTAVKIGKLVSPADWELWKTEKLMSVEQIAKHLGLHLNSVKRFIAESVCVETLPVKRFITDDFCESDGEPLEILAYYVWSRLSRLHTETLDAE